MISQQHFVIIGLDLTVYGLEEYKKRPKGYPVSIIFALHGRLRKSCKKKKRKEISFLKCVCVIRESIFDEALMRLTLLPQ